MEVNERRFVILNSADTKTNVSCFQRLPDQIKERNEKLKDEMFGKSF